MEDQIYNQKFEMKIEMKIFACFTNYFMYLFSPKSIPYVVHILIVNIDLRCVSDLIFGSDLKFNIKSAEFQGLRHVVER